MIIDQTKFAHQKRKKYCIKKVILHNLLQVYILDTFTHILFLANILY